MLIPAPIPASGLSNAASMLSPRGKQWGAGGLRVGATGTGRGTGSGGKMAARKSSAILGKEKSLMFRRLLKARNQSSDELRRELRVEALTGTS